MTNTKAHSVGGLTLGDTWATPDEVFKPLDAEFSFTLDPCATAQNARCEKYFTEDDDGLSQSWFAERVFMNPPYGKKIYDWVAKAHEEARKGALIVGLLPNATGTSWFRANVSGLSGSDLRFHRGRIPFIKPDGTKASPAFDSIIAVWRPFA